MLTAKSRPDSILLACALGIPEKVRFQIPAELISKSHEETVENVQELVREFFTQNGGEVEMLGGIRGFVAYVSLDDSQRIFRMDAQGYVAHCGGECECGKVGSGLQLKGRELPLGEYAQ